VTRIKNLAVGAGSPKPQGVIEVFADDLIPHSGFVTTTLARRRAAEATSAVTRPPQFAAIESIRGFCSEEMGRVRREIR
jgi:hypothetical protein